MFSNFFLNIFVLRSFFWEKDFNFRVPELAVKFSVFLFPKAILLNQITTSLFTFFSENDTCFNFWIFGSKSDCPERYKEAGSKGKCESSRFTCRKFIETGISENFFSLVFCSLFHPGFYFHQTSFHILLNIFFHFPFCIMKNFLWYQRPVFFQ